MTCPLCGEDNAKSVTYDDQRRELRADHGDGITCSAAPVDAAGRYLVVGMWLR